MRNKQGESKRNYFSRQNNNRTLNFVCILCKYLYLEFFHPVFSFFIFNSQKKKKVKPLVLDEAIWSNADIEFPSTSTSDDIEIIQKHDASPPITGLNQLAIDDVFVSEQVANADGACTKPTIDAECDAAKLKEDSNEPEEAQQAIENMSRDPTAPSLECVKMESKIVAEPIQPSAPHIDDLTVTTELTMPKNVQYPTLHEMSRLEPATISGLHQSGRQRIILQPFNEIQLKELYHNPELMLAERFETDFIGNELNCAYKEHPLYELIKKYSQSRYNLKMNMLDLQNYIKIVQVNLEDVWKISNLTINFEGVCLDNERVQKTERYE